MPRGPKKHLKRLNAPKHWMLGKLGGIFVRRIQSKGGFSRDARTMGARKLSTSFRGGRKKENEAGVRRVVRSVARDHRRSRRRERRRRLPRSFLLSRLSRLLPHQIYNYKTGPQALARTPQAARVPAAGDHAPKQAQVSFFFPSSARVAAIERASGGGGQSLLSSRCCIYFPGLASSPSSSRSPYGRSPRSIRIGVQAKKGFKRQEEARIKPEL